MTKKILVVDDEENLRTLVTEVLKNAGYVVDTADNGDDCLKKLWKDKYDFIIMDVMMPGTPVNDVVKKIKETKLMFLSVVGFTEPQKEKLRKMENVVDFMQKPFDVDDLVKKVKEHIG